jgi:hypothetical protein
VDRGPAEKVRRRSRTGEGKIPSYNDMAGGVAGRGRMCLRRTGGEGSDTGSRTGDGIGGGGELQRAEDVIERQVCVFWRRGEECRRPGTGGVLYHDGSVQISMLSATASARQRYPVLPDRPARPVFSRGRNVASLHLALSFMNHHLYHQATLRAALNPTVLQRYLGSWKPYLIPVAAT